MLSKIFNKWWVDTIFFFKFQWHHLSLSTWTPNEVSITLTEGKVHENKNFFWLIHYSDPSTSENIARHISGQNYLLKKIHIYWPFYCVVPANFSETFQDVNKIRPFPIHKYFCIENGGGGHSKGKKSWFNLIHILIKPRTLSRDCPTTPITQTWSCLTLLTPSQYYTLY